MNPILKTKIEGQIKNNKIMIYMKGNPQMPQCGFSAAAVDVLKSIGQPFESVDVLEDPEIRQGIKEYSNWPTIPQIYVDGEFIGGCDIMLEMHQRGELAPLINEATGSPEPA
ncbi:glutaredoxin-like protein [Thalassoporum mexicanum PCC 7367]|uniref:Grx4 family monothiol glutaredoxin n=1 Tax=Thalassoporum mexicanum TaxID=3457544 RepID=UPI00029FFD4F|nr:Grx4 family monothiol glutaredoxin [Pseudanabaena sp. PCC 7367]AFY68971.1 glutaredoxin-like protein [Pseudanabaena sp. PCC 7367]